MEYTIISIDLEGKTIFSIHEGILSAGWQIIRVNENIASCVYFVKLVFENRVVVRKLIVV